MGAIHRAPSDYGKEGDVLTVEFTFAGLPCIGLNGGPDIADIDADDLKRKSLKPLTNVR